MRPMRHAILSSITPVALAASLASAGGAADTVFISEVVDGTLTGGLPKWVEITNCGAEGVDLTDYSIGHYVNGETQLGGDRSALLSGAIGPGASYVINYDNADAPGRSTFFDVYGADPDDLTLGALFNGNDVIALFRADGSGPDGVATGDGSDATLVDVYGVVGEDGIGGPWEYTDSYARGRPGNGPSATFDVAAWIVAGADALETGKDAEETTLLQTLTSPGMHDCDRACPEDVTGDGLVGFADLIAVISLWGPCDDCPEDITGDGLVGFADLLCVISLWGPCP